MSRRIRGALLWIVLLDGLASLSLIGIGLVVRDAAVGSLGAVALLSWLVAAISVPRAAVHTDSQNLLLARTYVTTGMAMNGVGALLVLASFPPALLGAVALLLAGTGISLTYLTLLRALEPAPTGTPR